MQWCTQCDRESTAADGRHASSNPTCIHCGQQLGSSEHLADIDREDWELIEDLRTARAVVKGYRDAQAKPAPEIATGNEIAVATQSAADESPSSPQEFSPSRGLGVPFVCASLGLIAGVFATGLAEKTPWVFPWLLLAWFGFGLFLTIHMRRQHEPTGQRSVPVS